jgi:hypothetical protein
MNPQCILPQDLQEKIPLLGKKTIKELEKLLIVSHKDFITVKAGGLFIFTRSSLLAVSCAIEKISILTLLQTPKNPLLKIMLFFR